MTEGEETELTTAHRFWDRAWGDAAARRPWTTPEPEVTGLVPLLRRRGSRDVLDVGSGVGRHANHLAAEGFWVTAIDASQAGAGEGRRAALAAGLRVGYQVGRFSSLPYPDASFDFVLAWNVLYHGDRTTTREAWEEIHRVLRPGGLALGTMLSTRNADCGRGRQVAPGTFKVDGDPGDRSHPHLYVDAAGVIEVLGRLQVRSLVDREQNAPGSFHWVLLADRP
ncbi:MAG: class I SAM-dependent methyltransferase [Candidatus Dormibacteraceae bacterium]